MQMSGADRTSDGMNSVSVLWYGERGVVNSLVIAIQAGGVSAAIALLRQVQWADKSRPAWLSDIASVSMIVEPGCSQFGDPDLILVLTTSDTQRYVVYFEAKVVTYRASAVPNSQGMKEKKFNSAINGQLSLRYRMSLALAEWNGTADLVEPATIYNQYRRRSEDGGINERLTKARHLRKKSVLKLLRDAGVCGVPLSHFHFLAVTSDQQLDFSTNTSPEIRPLFLDNEGKDFWEQIAPRIGWLGFSAIDLTLLNAFLAASYQQALGTMLESKPVSAMTSDARNPPMTLPMKSINPYNISGKSSEATKNQLATIEEAARGVSRTWTVKHEPGSTSIKWFGKTIAKVVPQGHRENEILMLGISTIYGQQQWNGHSLVGPMIFKQQPFYWIDLPTDANGVDIAEGIFAQLATVSGAESKIE